MSISYAATAAPRRARRRRFRIAALWPRARTRRRALRALRATPLAVQIVIGAVALLMLWLAANWVYQVIRKPAELFFPVSGALYKTPPETWRQYEPIFRAHSTAVITPDFLAA